MKFKRISFKIYIIIFFLILLTIQYYINLKTAKFAEIVSVEIKTDEETFNNLKACRSSVTNFTSPLIKDSIYKSFYSYKNQYVKKIKISIPEIYIDNIESVNINIKNKVFNFTKMQFLKEWEFVIRDNGRIFSSPDYIRYSASKIPQLKSLINWGGDFNFIIKTFLYVFFIFFIFIILIFSFVLYIKNSDSYKKLKHDLTLTEKINYLIVNDKIIKITYLRIYLIIFFCILFLATIQRFTINQIPYGGNDTWSYIGSAVLSIDKNELVKYGTRNIFYPLFILINLSIFKDFSYITIVQHLMGLSTGIILMICFYRVSGYFNIIKNNKIFKDVLALILMSLFLFSESIIVYEHTLRPEGIYQFFLILQILLLIETVISINKRSKYLILFSNLFFINNIILFLIQPRWGFALFLNIIIYLILFFMIKMPLIKKTLYIILFPIVISFVFLYVPQFILTKGETSVKTFLSSKLFFTHIKIIDIELKKDINDPAFTKYDKEILKRLIEYHQEEYNKPQIKHKFLGFMHNNLIYGENCAYAYLLSKLGEKEYNKFARYYFLKAVTMHPDKYIKKVFQELSQFYNFYGGMYPARGFKIDSDAYEEGSITNLEIKNYIYRSYQNIRYNLEKSYYDFSEINYPFYNIFYLILSRLYLVTMIIFLILFFYDLFFSIKKRLFKINMIYGIIIFILYLFNFFINMTNALIYCLDVARYIDDQFIIILFSQILSLIYIINNLRFKKI
ncbi:MAG: hypothetical protein JXB50_08725 [Spirochaetes bacterium]|nr:hypothetical protein [Spirochaetota bacterium]